MNNKDEKIWVKCDYCGEGFFVLRKELDIPKEVAAITSTLVMPLAFKHPIIKGVVCTYNVAAMTNGDFCYKCCRVFLKLGLEKIEHQLKTGEFKELT